MELFIIAATLMSTPRDRKACFIGAHVRDRSKACLKENEGQLEGPLREGPPLLPLHARALSLHMEAHLAFGINTPGLSRGRKAVLWQGELN